MRRRGPPPRAGTTSAPGHLYRPQQWSGSLASFPLWTICRHRAVKWPSMDTFGVATSNAFAVKTHACNTHKNARARATPPIGTVQPLSLSVMPGVDPKLDAKLVVLGLYQKVSSPSPKWRDRAWKRFLREEDGGNANGAVEPMTSPQTKLSHRSHLPPKPPPVVPNPWKSPSWSTSGSAHLSATTLLIHEARAAVCQTASKLPSSPIKRRTAKATASNGTRYLGRPRHRPILPSIERRVHEQHNHEYSEQKEDNEEKEQKEQKQAGEDVGGHIIKPAPPLVPTLSVEATPPKVLTVMTPGGIRLPRRRPAIPSNPATSGKAKELYDEADFLDHRDATAAQIHRIYSTPRLQRLLQDSLSCATSPLKSAAMRTRKGDVVRTRADTPAMPMGTPARSSSSSSSSQALGAGSPAKSRVRGAIKHQVDTLRQVRLTALLEDPSRPLTFADVRTRLGLPSVSASVA